MKQTGGVSSRDLSAVVKSTDMTPDLESDIVNTAIKAMDDFDTDQSIARRLRQRLEEKFNNSIWHIVIGRKFATSTTHEAKHFIYFYIGTKAFLIFKSS